MLLKPKLNLMFMGIEDRVKKEDCAKKPMGKVNVIIEQKTIPCSGQRQCLTYFTIDLANTLFGKKNREPIPQPATIGAGSKSYYSVEFSGATSRSLSEVNKLLEEYALENPYTQIIMSGNGLSVKYIPKSAKSQSL